MSELKVNKISPKTACGTTTLGDSGDTFTIPAGVTITNNGTQTGFGRTGAVDWQTTPKTSTFTAVSGEGYFINSGSALTMNLPAGSAGAIVAISDYARNFATYNFTISPNGSEKIGGTAGDLTANVNGQALTLVYVDSTKGWVNVQNAEDTEVGSNFIIATGGTITTACTNFKVHTFTGPGTFCISAGSGPDAVLDYLVIAGGGAGGSSGGAGGGAGGYRESKTSPVSGCWTASPLASSTPLGPFSPGPISVTVGAGGAVNPTPCSTGTAGSAGAASVFSSITSAGGGGGGARSSSIGPVTNGGPGGSGGGGSWDIPGTNTASSGGTGNTPPVSPPQGNNGGYGRHNGPTHSVPGGGGGAGGAGDNEGSGGPAGYGTGDGGDGVASSINGTPTTRAGGGGGDTTYSGAGGPGGGGNRRVAGTVNTGGGGGGGSDTTPTAAGAGGSGLVIIRYKFQ
jgi:hypothetical protein